MQKARSAGVPGTSDPKAGAPEELQQLEAGLEGETVNPFAAPVGPATIVIFGASGDLTKRKLVPALCNLAAEKLLSEHVAVVGVARAEMDTEEFRRAVADDIAKFATGRIDAKLKERLLARFHYLAGDFTAEGTYARLKKLLREVDAKHKTGSNHLFYLATAPEYFAPIVRALGDSGLAEEKDGAWSRVIVEKPFGRDLVSARALNADLRCVLREEQIYRIDHYLGKETVQNILVFRFGNGMFEPIWNRRYIDNVQITVAETVGVENRGGYYETAGAMRDMVPNHMLQLLALTAMEPPNSFGSESVREEKAKVLRAITPMSPEAVMVNAVRGQYGPGSIAGTRVQGYRQEPRVAPTSDTETYVAMRLSVDNWRWADVPFYLRTGKRLAARVSEIAIQFRRPPLLFFRDTPVDRLSRNVLVIRVQPEDGIELRFGAKIPGPTLRVGNVAMDFRYKDYFGTDPSTGYETLLYDCMKGDQSLFQRGDMVEAGWAVVDPILEVWKSLRPEFPNHAAGTWGPKEADELLEREGRRWRKIDA